MNRLQNGDYACVPLEWFSQPFQNDLEILRPRFQRVVDPHRVQAIAENLMKKKDPENSLKRKDSPMPKEKDSSKASRKGGNIHQVGIIHIANLKGNRYLIDGQHRLAAYQLIQEPKTIMIQYWIVKTEEEMRQLFIEINNNLPLEEYIFNPDQEYKLGCDTLIQYVESEYRRFIKPRTNTGRNNFPNISSQTFRLVLPYIDDLKEINEKNAVDKFEVYNLKCKHKHEKNYQTKISQMELAAKEGKYRPLYINRDIMALWNKYASVIAG